MEGTWAADDLRRAFVAGAMWWNYALTGFTAFSSERDMAEEEADIRYPGGRPPNTGFHADQAGGPDNSEHSPETRPAYLQVRRGRNDDAI